MLEIVNYNKDEYDFPALVVLGCFDAIHVGHAELLKKAKLQAKINGLDLGVMMFAEGKGGRQVFTFEERLSFLSAYNVKFVLKIDYTEEFRKTPPLDFLHTVEEHVNAKAYMSGKDFRFGAGAKGKSSTLKNYAEDEDNGVWYMPVKDVTVDGEKVSTTLIKACLESGSIQRANALLGREFFVSGEVCEGHGRGRELGFPTANIIYPSDKVLVKSGVYGVEAEIDGTIYRGVANCGPRPTFGEDATVLEAYFEGLSGDIYGKTVTLKFLNYIRPVKKFGSAEELSSQIARDADTIGAPDNLDEDSCADADESIPLHECGAEDEAARQVADELFGEFEPWSDPEGAEESVDVQNESEQIAALAEELFGGDEQGDEVQAGGAAELLPCEQDSEEDAADAEESLSEEEENND